MSDATLTILFGLIAVEMINCKERDSKHFEDVAKAFKELKEYDDAR